MSKIDISPFIKIATKKDVVEIHNIFVNVTRWLRSMGVMQWDFSYPDVEIITKDIKSDSCLKVEIDGRIAAVVTLNMDQDPQYANISWSGGVDDIWVIHRLAVNPLFQNRGIASQLCKQLEHFALQKGAKAMRLDAYSENPYSNKMYVKLGYKLMDEPLFFHNNPIRFNAYEKLF